MIVKPWQLIHIFRKCCGPTQACYVLPVGGLEIWVMASWVPRVPGLRMGPKGQLSSWALALDLSRGEALSSRVLGFLPSTLGRPCLLGAVGRPMGELIFLPLQRTLYRGETEGCGYNA